MVAVKPRDIRTVLASADSRFRLFLFYGPDLGQSSARAAELAERLAGGDNRAIVWLDGDDLVHTPERLVEEAHSQNLFAPVRVIRVRAPSDRISAAVEPLIHAPPVDITILIEAGDLKKGSGLRKTVENAAVGAAIPAYGDTVRDLSALIDETLRARGIQIEPLARDLLIEHLGSDHAVSLGEIDKLLLYAYGSESISASDVEAICGDFAAAQFDALIDSVADGQSQMALTHFRRLTAAGTDPSQILVGLSGHLTALSRARASLDAGQAAESALQAALPRAHFSRKAGLIRQLRRWNGARLRTALQWVRDASRDGRIRSDVEPTLVGRTLLQISETAARHRA